MLRSLFATLLTSLLFVSPADAGWIIRKVSASGGGGGALVTDDFEDGANGTPTWTVASGTVNFAASGLTGTYAMEISPSSEVYVDFTASDEIWVAFQIVEDDPSYNSPDLLQLQNSSGVTQAKLQPRTDGTYRYYHGSAFDFSALVLVDGTTYWVVMRYVKGTGADGVGKMWVSAAGWPDTSLGTAWDFSTGTSTDQIARLRFSLHSSQTVKIDSLTISTTDPTL